MSLSRIYYINLERSPKRRVSIERLIKREFPHVPSKRVEAVDGLTVDFRKYRKMFSNPSWLTRNRFSGAFSCYLSHLKLWWDALGDTSLPDNALILVLEDDAKVVRSKIHQLPKVLEKIPDTCKWLALGLRRKKMRRRLHRNYLFSVPLAKNPHNVGTHAYVIRKKHIPDLLKVHVPFRYHHIDIRNRRNYKRLGFLCTTSNIFTVIGDGSVRRKIDATRSKEQRKKKRMK